MQNKTKTALLIVFFLVFYSVFGYINYINYGKPNNTQDFNFHWNKIKGLTKESYPELHHFIFSFFAFNEYTYYLANIILIIVLIPFLLFKLTKNFWSILIYFFSTSLSHALIYGATYPQTLILVFFLIYLLNRYNFGLLILLLILSGITHKSGAALFIVILLYEFISVWLETLIKSIKLKQKICSVGFLWGTKITSFFQVFELLFFVLPIPIIYFGLKKINKNHLFIYLSFISLLAAVMIDFRAISIMQICFIILAAEQIKESKPIIQKGFILFSITQLILYFYFFVLGTIRLFVN